MIKKILFSALILLVASTSILAQNENQKDKAIRVFLDCSFCDVDHIRKELTVVNYVRDRKDAQVHILTTTEYTGSGGRKYTTFFLGQKEFKGQADTLNFSITADATDDEIRNKQLDLLKIGLVRFVAKTPLTDRIKVTYEDKEDEEEITDKWNSWVFELNGDGYFNGEQSYKSMSLYSGVSAQRVTDDLKTEFWLSYNYSESVYKYDDTTVISTRNNKYFSHQLVKSINDHWSYGYELEVFSSLFQNIEFSTKLYPAIEYNIFPYSKSNRKQLRIIYGLGPKQFNYIDTTIYNKTAELLFGQQLGVATQFKEEWGTVNVSLVGNNYFHDIKKNRLEFYTRLNLRLFKGLSLSVQGGVSLIHDQLNLAKGDISPEDVLLHRKQLASQFDYWGSVGLSYSFGSIYNNVVNPRFGN